MSAVNDLRILVEMAASIERHGCGLFVVSALDLYMKTERGKIVGKTLAGISAKLYRAESENTQLRTIVENLRNDMDRANEEILRLEGMVVK